MHHLKETVIDGVKFVLIPETLHDSLVKFVLAESSLCIKQALDLVQDWQNYDPEVFHGV